MTTAARREHSRLTTSLVVVALATSIAVPATAPASATPASPLVTATAPPTPSPTWLRQKGVCQSACAVTGSTTTRHPTFGAIRLVLTLSSDRLQGTASAIDANRRVRWVRRVEDVGYGWRLYPRAAQDPTGNIYLQFDPGRYGSVALLRPTATGFTDLSTLPGKRFTFGRFYNSELLPAGKDRRYRVVHLTNECLPSCAAGTYTHQIYRWGGRDFTRDGPRRNGLGPRGL